MATDDRSAFETTASYEESQTEIYQAKFDTWVGQPMKILWDDYRGRFGLIVVTFYVLMGTVGTSIVHAPELNQGPRLVLPFTDPAFPLGTDGMGRDLLASMVWSTPDMLKMIIAGAIFGNLFGVSVGLYTGYVGGLTDKVILTITDTLGSIPGIPLLIILAAILEPSDPFLIGIMLNIQGWTGQVRGLRSQVIPLANEEHVEAGRALGQTKSTLLVREILPHLLPLIFIGFLGGATSVVFASVGLYFLGILPYTTNNWGITLNYAYQGGSLYSLRGAHWILVPLVTIVGLTMGLTMLAQAFDQVFNPRVRARHRARKQSSVEEEREVEESGDATDMQTNMGIR
jgi:peptide/nickel transport system permease protein